MTYHRQYIQDSRRLHSLYWGCVVIYMILIVMYLPMHWRRIISVIEVYACILFAMVMSLPLRICTQNTVNILQLASDYTLNRMISIIARIHNSTLLYGHIHTMISTSTVERLYAQAYIRIYMYAHVTHSAWLDFSHAYTVEFTVSKRTWVTFWSISIWWYLVGFNTNKIPSER